MRKPPLIPPSRTLRLLGLATCIAIAAALAGVPSASASSLRFTPMVRAVAAARPSVVNLHGRKTVRADQDPYATGDQFRQVNGMGTGVVIDERGYVITNYHVIEGVSRIRVTLADKQTVTGQLVAHDPETDLALIRIKVSGNLPVIKIGTSSDLMPAEPVAAVGNAYGYEHSVTQGIISELNRTVQVSDEQTYYNLIQTDAPINPGNSGGPLLNIDGDMIGLNVAVRVGAQGIGFAIPVDDVMAVAARLMSAERLGKISHGVVGKTEYRDNAFRFVVDSVSPNGPGDNAGLQAGDEITAVGEMKIARALDFERALLGKSAGDEVTLMARRNGDPVAINLVLRSAGTSQVSKEDRFWDVLGMRLSPIPQSTFQHINTRYRGGLKVTAVRPGGPADQKAISPGDILVGMHLWETISLDNVSYILNRPDFEQFQPVKFYILRSGETLYGHLHVSVSSRP